MLEDTETCDDWNTVSSDGCSDTCTVDDNATCTQHDGLDFTQCDVTDTPTEVICGDGTIGDDEQCDDGNTNDGDGCSSVCVTESTHICEHKTSDPTTWSDELTNADVDTVCQEIPSSIT